jgi:flagellar biosynthesis regulator FlaF
MIKEEAEVKTEEILQEMIRNSMIITGLRILEEEEVIMIDKEEENFQGVTTTTTIKIEVTMIQEGQEILEEATGITTMIMR